MTDSRNVVVLGGGIVGVAVASALLERGFDPTVIDRTGICDETSSGNAAALAFSDILPLAQKGMIRQVPRWLTDPLGPLSIAPAYLPRLLPWLWRFWRAGRAADRVSSVAAQAAMMRLAEAEWSSRMDRTRTGSFLREAGCLELYESEAEWRASLPGWAGRERFGIDHATVAIDWADDGQGQCSLSQAGHAPHGHDHGHDDRDRAHPRGAAGEGRAQ